MFDRAIGTSFGAPSKLCAAVQLTPSSRSSQIRTQRTSRTSLSLRAKRSTTLVVEQIAHRVVRQDISAQVHHSGREWSVWDNVRIARSTLVLFLLKVFLARF